MHAHQHIRDYLDEIFALIKKHWEDALMISIITLVEEISVALAEEFKVYLPDLIPSLLLILHTDRTDHRRHVQKVRRKQRKLCFFFFLF